MHPRIAELLDYAQRQRVALLDALSLIPEPMRDRRCDAATWSAAEVLEHLHRVERGIARLVSNSLEQARAAGLEPENGVGSVMESLDPLRLTDRRRRINAPEPVMPRGRLTAAEGMVALGESRQALISALQAVDGLALGRISQPHPLVGPLNLYQWVLFVGQHEARHAAQLRDIAHQLTT
ncbi:MAG TPA: DinB family protein [Gemmatimonadales bacterium]|jgi:hypothetical protein